jgi:hypothetical protein
MHAATWQPPLERARGLWGAVIGEPAELLGELLSSRQQLLQLGVLMVALNERLPDAYKLLPPVGHPGPGEGRRRSLRQVVTDRRATRSRHPHAPASGLAEWLADRQRQAAQHTERAGRARWPSGGWPRRCAPGPPTPTRRLAARSPTGRSRGATAIPRTTSATAGAPTGSAPSTSADQRLDGARAAAARPQLAAAGPRRRPGARPAAGPVAPLAGRGARQRPRGLLAPGCPHPHASPGTGPGLAVTYASVPPGSSPSCGVGC